MAAPSEFKPTIAGFMCNWCCYGGADLCGVSRLQYPPYLRVIRLMCSGRVDLSFVFKAFAQGADGVFIGGCHLNDCHYTPEGNYDALGNSLMARRILAHLGIEPERLRLEWVSAGEGTRFAEVMNELSTKVKSFGPLGSAEGLDRAEITARLEVALDLVPYIKLVERQALRVPVRTEDGYRDFFASREFDELFRSLILDKLTMGRIMRRLQSEPASAQSLGDGLALDASELARHLEQLATQGLIRFDHTMVLPA